MHKSPKPPKMLSRREVRALFEELQDEIEYVIATSFAVKKLQDTATLFNRSLESCLDDAIHLYVKTEMERWFSEKDEMTEINRVVRDLLNSI